MTENSKDPPIKNMHLQKCLNLGVHIIFDLVSNFKFTS